MGCEEEYDVGFVEKLRVKMGFEEEEEIFVEKLRVKTGFEEKWVVSKMESFLETFHNVSSSMNQEWMFSVLVIKLCIYMYIKIEYVFVCVFDVWIEDGAKKK